MSRFCAIYLRHQIRFRIAFPEEVSFVGGVCRRKTMSQGEEDFVSTCRAMWKLMRRWKYKEKVGSGKQLRLKRVEVANVGRGRNDRIQLSSGLNNLAINWELTRPTWSG